MGVTFHFSNKTEEFWYTEKDIIILFVIYDGYLKFLSLRRFRLLPLWDEVKIIDRQEHWRKICLKRKSAYGGLQWPVEQYRDGYDMGNNIQKSLMKKKCNMS